MDALQAYSDIVSLSIETDSCPHETLAHVANVEGFQEVSDHVGNLLVDTFAAYVNGQDDGTGLSNAIAHALVIMAGIGYAVGSEHAYDIVLSSDIVVPDSLAAMDWLESTGLDGRGSE